MPEIDDLAFEIKLAITLHTFVPTTRRARSEWADHASKVIAERLRLRWTFTQKPGLPLCPPMGGEAKPSG